MNRRSHSGGSAAFAETLERRALLTSVVVNTTIDSLFPPTSGLVSLRNAVATANSSASPTTITFDPTVFASAQTIVLNGSQLELGNVHQSTTIIGPLAGVTVSGGDLSTVLQIDGPSIENLSNLTFSDGVNDGSGSGIADDGATVTLTNVAVSGNGGGGILDSDASMTLTNVTVSRNNGGISNSDGTMTLTNVTISGNTDMDSYGTGGGIDNYGGTMTLTDDTVSGNMILGNYGDGGGIYNSGSINLTNVTVSGNAANTAGDEGSGGGICNEATLTIANSVVAGNSAWRGPDVYGTSFNSIGYNLIGKTDGSAGFNSLDLTGTIASPLSADLGPLANNGGPTQTMLPLTGSPAIGHGHVAYIPNGVTTDQRGLPRIVNGTVDIGSVEVQQTVAITWTGDGDGTNWNNPANWSNDAVPTQTSNPSIGAGFGSIEIPTGAYGVNSLTSASPVEVTAGATLTLNGASNFSAGVAIDPGGILKTAATTSSASPGPLVVAGLTILAGGILDLESSALVVRGGSLPIVSGEIASGYDGGTWEGSGIISSTAQSNSTHLTSLGVILNNNGSGNPLYGSGGTLGLFDGYSPAATDVLVKYTYYGDANLDGKVDGSDYSLIDNGALSHLSGWYNGDFDYSNSMDGSDYTLIDNAYNMQGASMAAELSEINSKSVQPSARRNRQSSLSPAVFQSATQISMAGEAESKIEALLLQQTDVLDGLGITAVS